MATRTQYNEVKILDAILASGELSAVCKAGGMGIIETSSGEIDNCKKEIQLMSNLTNKPFGVNLPLLFLQDDSMVKFCVQSGVKFVTTSAGDPTKYIK